LRRIADDHLLEDVQLAADRVAVIGDGHLHFDGTPEAMAELGRTATPNVPDLSSPLERGYRKVLTSSEED